MVVGIAGLVIGIEAKNNTNSDQQVAAQIKEQLSVSEKQGNSVLAKLNRVTQKQARVNGAQEAKIETLIKRTNSLSAQTKDNTAAVTQLQNQVANINKQLKKIQKELNQIGG